MQLVDRGDVRGELPNDLTENKEICSDEKDVVESEGRDGARTQKTLADFAGYVNT